MKCSCPRRPQLVTGVELEEILLKGELNEQVLREMREAGAYDALADSLDDVIARIEGRPAAKKTKTAYSSTPSSS